MLIQHFPGHSLPQSLILGLSCLTLLHAGSPDAPILPFEQSVKKFQLPEGYRLELVVGEPRVREPVLCVFDGNGRMYVAEMLTYMQDADATGEQERKSRVSLHQDTDGDGKMDKHTVFVDKLLLPRQILPLDDRVLIQETNTLDIFSYRDTNGDGVADEKKPFYIGGKRGGNMEHQPSGLIWSMDNWIYTTYNNYRLRYNPNGLADKEPTAPNGGQWGLCQDDHGKPWYVNAGGERGPLNFQQPIVYGQFNARDQFEPGYRTVYPLPMIPDVQGGPRRFRPADGSLNHFTATCGAEVFRGDRLPKDLRGDLLFAEPVGRLIRRSKVIVQKGVTTLKNAHPKNEFIRSNDLNFRAVNMTNAPDGTLYIVDMYRGIIQQGNWTRPGSYLRRVIDKHQLHKNIRHGRIYRLTHKDFKPGPQPRMLDETPAQLVKHLSHPNGWWRDTAQKLLVLRADKTVGPALKKVATRATDYRARMHAFWTLEGLDLATPDIVRLALKDPHPWVRVSGIRISETIFKNGDDSLTNDLRSMADDTDANVVVQTMMTARHLNLTGYRALITTAMAANSARGVQEFGQRMLGGHRAPQARISSQDMASYKRGKNIYAQLCFSCHNADGKGTPIAGNKTLAPSFVNSKMLRSHPDMAINVVLHGLTGPIDGKTYPGEMIAMGSHGDQWVADVLSYIRNSFGNSLGFITKEQVKQARTRYPRKKPWTIEELRAAVPRALNRSKWKLTASHNPGGLKNAIDANLNSRYTTNQPMKKGMWLGIELPRETTVCGVTLDAAKSDADFPRSYIVEVSQNGKDWTKVASGKAKGAMLSVNFEHHQAKYLRVTQTGKHDRYYWSVHELNVYGK